jgi:hypothetical protein
VDIYQTLEAWTMPAMLLALAALLLLQLAVFRRSGHKSFLLFSLGCALCIIYALFSAVPFFVSINDSQRLFLFACSCAAPIVAAVLALSGSVMLLRSHDSFSQVAPHSSFKAPARP